MVKYIVFRPSVRWGRYLNQYYTHYSRKTLLQSVEIVIREVGYGGGGGLGRGREELG